MKEMDLGFVIICHDTNPNNLRATMNSIRRYYKEQVIAIVPEGVQQRELECLKSICPIEVGSGTVTSLINKGIESSKYSWNMLVMSGAWVIKNLDRKYSTFLEKNTDVFFPISGDKTSFLDCSLNGIVISKETWKLVGPFSSKNPLPICRLMWALEALDKGVKLKGIVGVKII